MTTGFIMDIGRQSILTGLMVVGPVMAVGFIVGLLVSLFQAVTQMQEVTIGFVPKIVAISAAIVVFGHWMLNHVITYSQHLFGGFDKMIGL